MSYNIHYIETTSFDTYDKTGSYSPSPSRYSPIVRSPNTRSFLASNNEGGSPRLCKNSSASYDNVISLLDNLIGKEKDTKFDTIKHCKHCHYKFRREYSPFAEFCSKECKCCFEWFLKKDDNANSSNNPQQLLLQQQQQQLQQQRRQQELQDKELQEQMQLDGETTSEEIDTDDDDDGRGSTWHTCPGYTKQT